MGVRKRQCCLSKQLFPFSAQPILPTRQDSQPLATACGGTSIRNDLRSGSGVGFTVAEWNDLYSNRYRVNFMVKWKKASKIKGFWFFTCCTILQHVLYNRSTHVVFYLQQVL